MCADRALSFSGSGSQLMGTASAQPSPGVLIVEDEALLLHVIADILRDAGYVVLEVIDAELR
jgi:hypothetical protein